MPPRKRVNKNLVQKAISAHSMKLRSRPIVCSNENILQFGFDTKLSASSSSMTLRTWKPRPTVVATSKAKARIEKFVRKSQRRQVGKSAQTCTPNHIEPLKIISNRIKTFGDLNDDCVYIIFGKFGLQQLMLMRAISTRCLFITEKIFCGMRSLKLFVGYSSVHEYFRNVKLLKMKDDDFRFKPNEHAKNDDLVLSYPKVTTFGSKAYDADVNPTTFLPRLFPNVEKLFISLSIVYHDFRNNVNLFEFSSLLQEFPHLSTLFMMNPSSDETNLWGNIASKTSLRSLYLISIECIEYIPTNIYHNLQQLTIVTRDYGMDLVLPHIGPNCTQIAFYWSRWESEQLQAGLNLNPHNLKNTITHFSIGSPDYAFSRKDLLLSICAQMKSLTFLEVSLRLKKFDPKDIFTQLASLPRLTELRLLDLNNEHLETDESKASSFRPLSSITNLSLGIFDNKLNIKFYILQDIFTKVFPSLIKATIICNDQTILNQSRECFTNTRRFPHLLESSFYADSDAMFEPAKYFGRHYNNFHLTELN